MMLGGFYETELSFKNARVKVQKYRFSFYVLHRKLRNEYLSLLSICIRITGVSENVHIVHLPFWGSNSFLYIA
jgi:hypothetical protein